MTKAILLILIAVVTALVDLFKGALKPGEPRWPRWVKLGCAVTVAILGFLTIFDGYFAGKRGLLMYNKAKPNLIGAQSALREASLSPFRSRENLDTLGLVYKNLADNAAEAPVARDYYNKALSTFFDSRTMYPQEMFALNNMINIYRRLRDWNQVALLVESCEAALSIEGELRNNGKPLSAESKATILVALGNVYADDMYTKHDPKLAVDYYRKAMKHDQSNIFVKLNLPVRLITLAEKSPQLSERLALLQEAYDVASKWKDYSKLSDRIFSLVNIVQTLSRPESSKLKLSGIGLDGAIREIQALEESWRDSDHEMWFVLADASIFQQRFDKAEEYLNRARRYVDRFTDEQKDEARRLTETIEANRVAGGLSPPAPTPLGKRVRTGRFT